MELYYSPLACSMASRILIREADANVHFRQVDTRAHRVEDGSDYFAVNPLGQVPALRTEDGTVLTENPAVLQYLADRFGDRGLAPADAAERYRTQQWLNFISTELHKAIFVPLLDPTAGPEVKAYARAKIASRMAVLERWLQGRDTVLSRFGAVDAYLVTVLNWSGFTAVDLAPWPAVQRWFRATSKWPSVQRAMSEEVALYQAKQAAAQAA